MSHAMTALQKQSYRESWIR